MEIRLAFSLSVFLKLKKGYFGRLSLNLCEIDRVIILFGLFVLIGFNPLWMF